MQSFFYDTWAFIALADSADPNHELAVEADRSLENKGYVAVTSDYVLDETLTGIHTAVGHRAASSFADLLLARVEAEELVLLEITGPRRGKALELFHRLAPEVPRLSFTDCTSFALMRELGIGIAFTADRHFHQAGKGIRPLFEREGSTVSLRLPA